MGKWCLNCGRMMKNPELTHCSDECLMNHVKKSKTKRNDNKDAESWEEKTDPWK
jgi:hypothetical protein